MNIRESKTELIEIYRQLGRRAGDLRCELRRRMGTPYVIWPHDVWWTASIRIMLVGQEPLQWGFTTTSDHYPWPHAENVFSLDEFTSFDWASEALMDGYTATYYGEDQKYTSGSFARATSLVGTRHPNAAVVSTNLFRCAVDKEGVKGYSAVWNTNPTERSSILSWQHGVLRDEIRLLRPDVILFLTGPDYDEALDAEIPGIVRVAMHGKTARQMARLEHNELPFRSFRTYHPGFLRRGHWHWLVELLDDLREAGDDRPA